MMFSVTLCRRAPSLCLQQPRPLLSRKQYPSQPSGFQECNIRSVRHVNRQFWQLASGSQVKDVARHSRTWNLKGIERNLTEIPSMTELTDVAGVRLGRMLSTDLSA